MPYSEYESFLEENGIRASSQRILMLEYLDNNIMHPTADTIYSELLTKLPSISKATVYNNLKLFIKKGILNEINVDNTEVHYEINGTPHAHFICTECNRIFDADLVNLEYDTTVLDGFLIQSQNVYLKGKCKECKEKEQTYNN